MGNMNKYMRNQRGANDCALTSLVLCCQIIPCQGAIAIYLMRRRMIQVYGIETDEDETMTAVWSFLCGPCAGCQMLNEVRVRENLAFNPKQPWEMMPGNPPGAAPGAARGT